MTRYDSASWSTRVTRQVSRLAVLSVAMVLTLLVSAASAYEQVTEGVYDQLLDHSDKRNFSTFKQRYFVIGDFADRNQKAPVLYYICDHGPCTIDRLPKGASLIAQQMGAYIVALEMRYRGESQPFQDFSPQSLKFLKFDLIIEDLVRFQTHVVNRLGLNGSWFSYGGSYAGTIASALQVRAAGSVVAAIASSAPIIPMLEYPGFDASSNLVMSEACRTKLRDIVETVDGNAGRAVGLAGIKPRVLSEIEFAENMLVAMVGDAQLRNWSADLCDALAKGRGSSQQMGEALVQQRIQRAKTAGPKSNLEFNSDSDQPLVYQEQKVSGTLQWNWQVCTELGWFQVSSPVGVRPKNHNLAKELDHCQRYFGTTAPPEPEKALGPYMNPLLQGQESRVLLINYKTDPWFMAGINGQTIKNYPRSKVSFLDIGYGFHTRDLQGRPEDQNIRDRIVQFLRRYVPDTGSGVSARHGDHPWNRRNLVARRATGEIEAALGLDVQDLRVTPFWGDTIWGDTIASFAFGERDGELRPVVHAVAPGSKAASLGIGVGTTVLTAEGRETRSLAELATAVRARLAAGSKDITLKVWTGAERGSLKTITVPLASAAATSPR